MCQKACEQVIDAARTFLAQETSIARSIYSKWVGGANGSVHDPANWVWSDEIWQRVDPCQFLIAKALRDALANYDAVITPPESHT